MIVALHWQAHVCWTKESIFSRYTYDIHCILRTYHNVCNVYIFSKGKEPGKPVISEDSRNVTHNSTDNNRTSTDDHNSVVTDEIAATATKGKRLKIVEVEYENETADNTEILTDESCGGNTNKLSDTMQQMESSDRTNDIPTVDTPQVEKQPELPGLVLKAQNEGTQLFKLGRFAEAAEQYTKAIDILEKGNFSKFQLCFILVLVFKRLLKLLSFDLTMCINIFLRLSEVN